jgi:defect-in-organelle-trafficking protein DotA
MGGAYFSYKIIEEKMKNYPKTLWAGLGLFLLLFAGTALATTNPGIVSDAVTNKTDISIAYLSSVFGTVSGVLTGTSGQMLGKLIYQFNQGMLVVAGLWLAFSVLQICFRSGMSGSFMQQQEGKSAPLIFLRVALGFGLLIPNPSTGYTLLQGIVMQVTVQGVKLADQVWEYGLDYLNAGGALWSRPVQQKSESDNLRRSDALMSNDDVNKILGDESKTDVTVPAYFSQNLSMVQKIMAMEACMVRSSIEFSRSDNSSNDNDTSSVATPNFPLNVQENLNNYSFEFPGGYQTGYGSKGNTTCGAVFWNQLEGKALSDCQPGDNSGSTTQCEFSHLALKEVVTDLLPVVHKWVCATAANADQASECNGVDTDVSQVTYIADAMMSATINYKNLIDPVVRKDSISDSSQAGAMKFYDQARKDGWMTAGRYYWDMLQLEDAYDKAMTNNQSYSGFTPGNYQPPSDKPPYPQALDSANRLMSYTLGSQGIPLAKSYMSGFTDASQAGTAVLASNKSAAGATSGLGLPLAAAMIALKFIPGVGTVLASIISDFIQIILSFSQYSTTALGGLGAEPISWMHKLGLKLISFGFNIWIGIAVVLLPAGIVLNTCGAVNPGGQTFKTFLDWLQPLLLAGAAGFIAIGFSIGFYIPLYPYMLFTFGVIGWIIAVIEAMVAAPLVALGITHPEGHDFLGRAQQAMMLLISLFLRPVLMLIGLFAGMILCQVSLSIVLYTFSGFCADIFYIASPIKGQGLQGDLVLQSAGAVMGRTFIEGGGTGLGKIITSLLVFPLFLAVFTMMVYTTTVTCFSLIHQLADYILAWIGGPQSHGANAQTMLDQVKQGMTQGIHKGAEGVAQSNRGREFGADGRVVIPGLQQQGGNNQLGGNNQHGGGNNGGNP